MRMWDKGIWGFGGMGVLVGLRRERDGSVGVEGNVGGTKGHEEGDTDIRLASILLFGLYMV